VVTPERDDPVRRPVAAGGGDAGRVESGAGDHVLGVHRLAALEDEAATSVAPVQAVTSALR
jgi:hypothetical protein